MVVLHSSVAGTLESSDALVTINPASDGLSLHIESSVLNQFGKQIKAVVADVLKEMKVEYGEVTVVDRGALDCTLRARVMTAILRAANQSYDFPGWREVTNEKRGE